MTMSQESSSQPIATSRILAGLAGAMLTAWGVRSLVVASVFLGDGTVLLGLDDSAYHARRALYSFVNFPAILHFDSYIAYPDGSPIPSPPLYDWLLGGVARLFGRAVITFESVVAWAAVFFATVTVLPVYAMCRSLLGARAGLVAAWIFAVLPASSLVSTVGYVDHHSAVDFLAACWLWSSIREICDEPGRRVLRAALHAAIVVALTLTWGGSLLYIGLGEGARLLVGGILWRRPGRLLAQSGGALFAAALVAPWVAMAPEPIGGAYSSTTLSWLQVLVLIALGVLAAALAGLENLRPEPRLHMRALRAITVTAAIALPILAIPGVGDSLASGTAFVAGEDVWAPTNVEQQPLYSLTLAGLHHWPTARFGWFAFLVPLLPLLVVSGFRQRDRRESTALLFIWTTVLTALALQQLRFVHDLAPLASVVFAGTLAALYGQIHRVLPARPASIAIIVLALVLLWPAFSEVHLPRAQWALQTLESGGDRGSALLTPMESEIRFGMSVRQATPETSGYLDRRLTPEYGLLVDTRKKISG